MPVGPPKFWQSQGMSTFLPPPPPKIIIVPAPLPQVIFIIAWYRIPGLGNDMQYLRTVVMLPIPAEGELKLSDVLGNDTEIQKMVHSTAAAAPQVMDAIMNALVQPDKVCLVCCSSFFFVLLSLLMNLCNHFPFSSIHRIVQLLLFLLLSLLFLLSFCSCYSFFSFLFSFFSFSFILPVSTLLHNISLI